MAWVLLQISCRIQQYMYFDNRPTFVKVMNECIVAQFFSLTVYNKQTTFLTGVALRACLTSCTDIYIIPYFVLFL